MGGVCGSLKAGTDCPRKPEHRQTRPSAQFKQLPGISAAPLDLTFKTKRKKDLKENENKEENSKKRRKSSFSGALNKF